MTGLSLSITFLSQMLETEILTTNEFLKLILVTSSMLKCKALEVTVTLTFIFIPIDLSIWNAPQNPGLSQRCVLTARYRREFNCGDNYTYLSVLSLAAASRVPN